MDRINIDRPGIDSKTLWWVAGVLGLIALTGVLMSTVGDNGMDGRAAVPPNTESTGNAGSPGIPNAGSDRTPR